MEPRTLALFDGFTWAYAAIGTKGLPMTQIPSLSSLDSLPAAGTALGMTIYRSGYVINAESAEIAKIK